MRARLPAFLLGTFLFGSWFLACSSNKPPPPGNNDLSGEAGKVDVIIDSGPDDDAEADDAEAGDAEIPKSCTNTIRDGNETDVDCGGNQCPKCIDGKACVAPTDCAGGSCVDNKCETAKCNDVVTNGDESDVDCGGSICARCTIGKRCKDGKDCVSGTCTNDACACPPGMAIVSKATGGAYCIDRAEVSKGQYNKFLTANVLVQDQLDICKPPANPSFVPRGAWPPATTPPTSNGLPYNLSLPVHYVDWCDAYAYCRWANKQLCGQINGGSVDPAKADSPDAGAWFNACSAQGTFAYPYGPNFTADKCNGSGALDAGVGFGFAINQDDGLYAVVQSDQNGNHANYANEGCQGGSVGVYQMSGNAAEWEDSCDANTTDANCRLRGGSYAAADNAAALACAAQRTEKRLPPVSVPDPLKDIGFRCCLY